MIFERLPRTFRANRVGEELTSYLISQIDLDAIGELMLEFSTTPLFDTRFDRSVRAQVKIHPTNLVQLIQKYDIPDMTS